MKLAIVSYGHAESILHYAKTLSSVYEVELIFVFALNKRIESLLNFERENIYTGFLDDKIVEKILGKEIIKFADNKYKIRFFINKNLKVYSLKNISLSKKLSKELKEFDIIHFNGTDATLLLLNYFLRKKKKVFTIHDVTQHSGGSKVKLNFADIFSRWIINSKHQVIIHNSFDYNNMLKLYPGGKNKLNFIPIKAAKIYTYFLNGNSKNVESDILFFGRISPYKGLKYLINAIDIVKKVFPRVKVLIAGKGNLGPDIDKEKLTTNFIIYNRYITNEEAANFISNTKFVVCPYTDETQSGVALTAFAFGKPIIASDVGGFSDIIKNNGTGLLVPPGNTEKLAEAIISLLKNENLVREMSENIIKKSNEGELSWDSVLNDALNVYNKAINN